MSKDQKKQLDGSGNSIEAISDERSHDITNSGGNDKDKEQQITNDAVEAAVMRYVGGDFNQWGIFEDDIPLNKPKKKKDGRSDEVDDGGKKRRKLDAQGGREVNPVQGSEDSGNSGPGTEGPHGEVRAKNALVDPELAQLDSSTNEHDQLVQAAINDAKQLASFSGFDANSYIDNDKQQGGAVGAGQPVGGVINQPIAGGKPGGRGQYGQHRGEMVSIPNTDVATLVAQAANEARAHVTQRPVGKMFSKQEHEGIDNFITSYCQINNLTREDICKRIWSNNRVKDNFWESLQQVLPDRTRASVYKHVRRAYHVFAVRGKWTPEEDAQLGELAKDREGQWKQIGEIMGRMPEDCRDRWRNYVKCGNIRAQNKWLLAEEDKLKQIIGEIFLANPDNPVINWTVVSDKMGGVRSRIQCRYKWHKLLKRQASQRAANMNEQEKYWLLSRLKEMYYNGRLDSDNEVDWESLAYIHPSKYWTGSDFRMSYEKMRSNIKDFKHKKMDEICSILIDEIYGGGARLVGGNNNVFDVGQIVQKGEDVKKEKPGEDVEIATAAAAVAAADLWNPRQT